MLCRACREEAPLWARDCARCGAALLRVPAPAPPRDLPPEARPVVEGPVLPPEPIAEGGDYRAHLTVGALLAVVATLVIPPLFGGIAFALGWLAFARGRGVQRRQGLLLMLASIAATIGGIAVLFWVTESGLLPTA